MLRDSWVYQEIGQEYLEKGLEQGLTLGRAQALHSVLLTCMETHFPELVVLAQQQTRFITDPEMLNHIISKLFALQTAEEVEQYLKALGKDETKN